jgi:hypothetical protein
MEKTYKEKYSIVLFMIAKKKYNLGWTEKKIWKKKNQVCLVWH